MKDWENDYEQIEFIAPGSFGKVYKVRNRKTDQIFALKEFVLTDPSNDDLFTRFVNESPILASLDHPNIVPVIESRMDLAHPYFVMPCYPFTLGALRDASQLPSRPGLMMRPILDAVEYLHSKGYIHRDLHPGNIFVNGDSFVIGDFSLAKNIFDGHHLTVDTLEGNRLYTAPEQHVRGGITDERSDVFALGSLTILAVTLRDPAISSDANKRIPREYRAIISKCRSEDPAHRYQSVSELRSSLESIWDHEESWQALTEVRDLNIQSIGDADVLLRKLVVAASNDWFAPINRLNQMEALELEQLVAIPSFTSLLDQITEGALRRFTPWERFEPLAKFYCRVAASTHDVETVIECLDALLRIGNQHDRWSYRKYIKLLSNDALRIEGFQFALQALLRDRNEEFRWLEAKRHFRPAS